MSVTCLLVKVKLEKVCSSELQKPPVKYAWSTTLWQSSVSAHGRMKRDDGAFGGSREGRG